MPTKSKSTKRRTQVQDIPGSKALTKGEKKKVKGGFRGGVIVAAGDVDHVVQVPTSLSTVDLETKKLKAQG